MKKQMTESRLYTLWEAYIIIYKAIRTFPYLIRGGKNGDMSKKLEERLMIAVTEVNGCAICSYAHTKIALEAGLSAEEIGAMLSGEMRDVPQEEMKAVLFAQHYADTRGKPSYEAWRQIVSVYGQAKAMAILGAIRGIMGGNAYGIPAGSLLGRMGVKRFHTDARSSLPYELGMMLSMILFPPIAALHAGAAWLLRLPAAPKGEETAKQR